MQKKGRIRKGFAIFGASFVLASAMQGTNVVYAQENLPVVGAVKATNPFLQAIIPSASVIAHENDLYASVMMAQAILESGWGTSKLAAAPNHNLFGIKGDYKGQSVNMNTLEDSGGQNYYSIQANFRKYPSYKESLEDYASVLRNGTSWDPLFYSGTWKSNTQSYQDATSHLTGRYATDSAYGTKLNGIIEKNNLTAYDTPAGSGEKGSTAQTPQVNTAPAKKPVVESNTASGKAYTVKPGDSLWAIAEQNGLTLSALQGLNPSVGTVIHPGQVLVIAKGTSNTTATQTAVQTTEAESGSSQKATGSYKVQKGDTLWSISQEHGMTVSQLREWNQLRSDLLSVGQTLQVEQSAPVVSKPVQKPVAEMSAPVQVKTTGTITVMSGDTLYSIANRSGMTVQALKSINNLKTDVIYPGQELLTEVSAPAAPEKKPAVSEKPVEKNTGITYEVQKGDTLYSIANRAGVSVAELKSWNGLTGETIHVGQSLNLGKENQKAALTQQAAGTKATNYQVQKGDTLYSIANRAGVSVTELKAWNGLSNETIYVGQQLSLQKGNQPKPASSTSAATYQVKKGDTLYSIAREAGLTVEQLLRVNALKSDTIYPGQTLKVK